jgi:hypothetical protein
MSVFLSLSVWQRTWISEGLGGLGEDWKIGRLGRTGQKS